MVRWEAGTRERLQAAALDLYATRGFDDTTVADIAAAVGVTERTFFRHFADKREVLFGGTEAFQAGFLEGIENAPDGAEPIEIIRHAVLSASGFFAEERRPHSRLRQRVIVANPEIQERELLKMSALATVLASALRDRGTAEPSATLAAESGVLVFRLAFEQWLESDRSLAEIESDLFAQFGALAAK
jgi:AcrR family transcriptional regulator